MLVIEMNPRVSRSSALRPRRRDSRSPASAPSWPSATRWTSCRTTSPKPLRRRSSPCSITSWSKCRGSRSKVPTADFRLTTQMKSVGEADGHRTHVQGTFKKGIRALEIGRPGWVVGGSLADDRLTSDTPEDLRVALRTPRPSASSRSKRGLARGRLRRSRRAGIGYRSLVPLSNGRATSRRSAGSPRSPQGSQAPPSGSDSVLGVVRAVEGRGSRTDSRRRFTVL